MFSLNCKGKMLMMDHPLVMGILNVNGDSFYPGNRAQQIDLILQKAAQMISEGAGLIDIGGQSTRPGSERISFDEECSRVIPAIEAVASQFPGTIISIDTYYAEVARQAVAAGATMVNDISAGEMDSNMIATVATLKIPYVCMHMKGTPDTMQQQAVYENVTIEVLDFFIKKVDELKMAGINDIIIDPGFGFGKTIGHNFSLLKNLSAFKMLDLPIMAGLSRKSTIYKTLDISVEDALNGTTVLNTLALQNGAGILRVHDVKEAVETVKLFTAYSKA